MGPTHIPVYSPNPLQIIYNAYSSVSLCEALLYCIAQGMESEIMSTSSVQMFLFLNILKSQLFTSEDRELVDMGD